MAFTGQFITVVGLVKIALPAKTILLCDGGTLLWGTDRYWSMDPDFGTISAISPPSETISDEAPSGRITLMPPSLTSAETLFESNAQGCPINFWLGEVDTSTGLIFGSPDLVFSGFVDTLTLKVGRTSRTVDIDFMSSAERLFAIREGNVLSPRFHQTAWPGENGFRAATGLQTSVPWGVVGPPRGTVGGGGGGFGGGIASYRVNNF